MKTVAIALAFGDIYLEAGTGPLKVPLDGGVIRFEELIQDLPHEEKIARIICTAGYSRNHPRTPYEGRPVSLADQLKRYAEKHQADHVAQLFAQPLCWSTINEIRLGIKLAQRHGFVRKDEDVTLRIASNPLHLLRVRMYVWRYAPKSWKREFVSVNHSFSWHSQVGEALKFLRDAHYLLCMRYRLWRLTTKQKMTP